MTAEIIHNARRIGTSDFFTMIDSRGRLWASSPSELNRFGNPFLRDAAINTQQILPVAGNEELADPIGTATVNTADLFIQKAKKRTLNPSLLVLHKGGWPGEVDHELHDQYTVQSRAEYLAKDGWTHKKVKGKYQVYSPGEADDANANLVILAEMAITSLINTNQKEKAIRKLKSWWGILELVTLNDIYRADREGNYLIETYPDPTKNIRNRTLRDSGDAFLKDGQVPDGKLTFFANNCFHITALESMSTLAELMDLPGFAEALKRRGQKVMEAVHDKFWWEDQQLYAPILDESGKRLEIISNESSIGLFTGALDPHFAKLSAERLLEADFLTSSGTRTRSLKDSDFDFFAYQRGTVWPVFDTMLYLGATQKYNLTNVAETIGQRTVVLVNNFGSEELVCVDSGGNVLYYTENGQRAGCNPHGFTASGIIGVTAVELQQLQAAA
jgi:glycogen debranching enzyme